MEIGCARAKAGTACAIPGCGGLGAYSLTETPRAFILR
jgi:hypothetical protein